MENETPEAKAERWCETYQAERNLRWAAEKKLEVLSASIDYALGIMVAQGHIRLSDIQELSDVASAPINVTTKRQHPGQAKTTPHSWRVGP